MHLISPTQNENKQLRLFITYIFYCQGWRSCSPASVGRVHQEGEEGHKERSDGEGGGGEEGGGGLWIRLAWPPHPSPDGQVGWKHYQVSPSLTFSSPDTSPASPPSSPPVSRISQMGNSNKVPSQPSSITININIIIILRSPTFPLPGGLQA